MATHPPRNLAPAGSCCHHKSWKGQREEVELKGPRSCGHCVGVKQRGTLHLSGAGHDFSLILPDVFQQCLLVAKARHKAANRPWESAACRSEHL